MKYSEGSIGRIFILRLEENDIIPGCIEIFAREKCISSGIVLITGGVNNGNIVVGPEDTSAERPVKMLRKISEAHELTASGIIAPDLSGNPVLHIHGSMGRAGNTITGCLREGVSVWLVCEAVIIEISDADTRRVYDEASGFTLLDII